MEAETATSTSTVNWELLHQRYELHGSNLRGCQAWQRQSQLSLLDRQLTCLTEQVVPAQQLAQLDKCFTSVWLDSRHVVVGSKCHRCLLLDTASMTFRQLDLPCVPASSRPRATARTVEGQPDDRHRGGIHTLSLDLRLSLLAVGGPDPRDATVLSLPDLQPVCTFMGHQDWVFCSAWVDTGVLLTGGRDATLRLWHVPPTGDYGPDCHIVGKKRGVVRIKCRAPVCKPRALEYCEVWGRAAVMCTDSVVRLYDVAGGMREADQFQLDVSDDELVCMACQPGPQGGLLATGARSLVSLMDPRCPGLVARVPHNDIKGLRSLSFNGQLLCCGGCMGSLTFLDLRMAGAEAEAGGGAGPLAALANAGWLRHGQGPREGEEVVHEMQAGWLEPNDVYRTHFQAMGAEVVQSCFTHSWSPDYSRLFTGGGPLAYGLVGCCMSVWS